MLKSHLICLCSILMTLSCSQDDSDLNIIMESELGCVDETLLQITDIPYLTTKNGLVNAITLSPNYKLEIFMSDMKTVATTVKTNYFLGVVKNENVIKYYKLFKQELEGENRVNGDFTITKVKQLCNDPFSTQATAITVYFEAVKDSTYDIYAYNGDSASGIGFISALDSVENKYFMDEPSGTNAGSGCFGDPCSDANMYTLISNITGKIYIEIYGLEADDILDPGFPLNPWVYIWVKN